MKRLLAGLATALLALLTAIPAGATCGGGGGGGTGGMAPRMGGNEPPRVYQVPWKLVGPDQPMPAGRGLIVYWFPATVKEIKESGLVTSRDLTMYSAQCVATWIADAGTAMGKRFDVSVAKLPAVVLTDTAGSVVGRLENEDGKINVSGVEKLVREELKKREQDLKLKAQDAEAKIKAGATVSAVAVYKEIWEERCLFPKQAKNAAKQLKKLGSPVEEENSQLQPFEPLVDSPRAAEVEKTMQRGLMAEEAGLYLAAIEDYKQAQRLDPADPVPTRYLAELYRHHTGEWKKSRQIYEAMLTRPIDTVSRAVALHGLGKMTIHEGQFDKGRSMMEESVKVFPLALAYRNLAVYWNSEGDAAKTAEYVQKALDLNPDDPYNRVFAAVFWAASGRGEEALKIAQDNEGLLPASYNLAAIYAQNGQRDLALKFLKRHFYQYERYAAVRSEEMMEARVDAVFASIVKDPEFLDLTKHADGMLGMRMTAH
jgi:tetratricopeptide (TPR) repeat protein